METTEDTFEAPIESAWPEYNKPSKTEDKFIILPKKSVYGSWLFLRTVKIITTYYRTGPDLSYYSPKEYTFAAVKGDL